MYDDFLQMARRIREMREICGFSVDEIAQELNVSRAVYESFERSGEDIPISVLYELARCFRVDLHEILTGQTPRLDDYCLVRRGMGTHIERFPGYRFESLANRFANKIMQPLLVTVEPSDTEPTLITHKGQEFNMVLEGKVMVIFDDKRLILEEGDCLYFNPEHPHGQTAANDQPAVFLTVITEAGNPG